MSEPKCVAGCKSFYGGEIKHHKDCPYYPESLSKMYDDLNDKLRWIPVEEKLPEDCPEMFLKKCMSKNVLIKRKWLDTGEIVIEINSRFSPSERIGFLWNYDYPNSEIVEWRSFL